MQKRPRAKIEADFRTVFRVMSRDVQNIQRFDRTVCLTDRGAEGREIVLAYQMACTGLHGPGIQIVLHAPDEPAQMGCRRATHEQAEDVAPLAR